MHLTYGEGWFLRIKVAYFCDNLDYLSTFPISVLKEAFQETSCVLRVTWVAYCLEGGTV